MQIVEETIPELVKLKEEGLVRHIGITGLPLAIYKNVLDRCRFLCTSANILLAEWIFISRNECCGSNSSMMYASCKRLRKIMAPSNQK